MSVFKHDGVYAIVHINEKKQAEQSGALAVVQICFGSPQNSLSLVYAKFEEGLGFQVPTKSVMVRGERKKIPLIQGEPAKELLQWANAAIERVKEHISPLRSNVSYRVFREEGKTVVHEWTE